MKGRGGLEDTAEPLLPKPARASAASSGGPSTSAIVWTLILFVTIRSVHPIIIDISKTDGRLAYGKATPCVINSFVDVVLGNGISFAVGGLEGLRRCWNPRPLKIFSMIAIVYAFGDFLEMQSMSVMGGAVYQLLLQSKLLITALIIWAVRNERQSVLQWIILTNIACAMSAFVLVDEGSKSSGGGSSIGFAAVLFVVAKVFFSCLCAVLAEKYLKAFKDMPIYMQVAQLKFSWFWTTLALTFIFDRGVVENGFFSGWDGRTIAVATSWVCKGWSTFLVLKILNSVLKNIGEAVAIVVIYSFDVFFASYLVDVLPVKAKDFRLEVFLMVFVVVLTVVTYTFAPKPGVR